MLLESGLDVACSSISAGETNASIDWYFTVVTLGERKGRGVGGRKKRKKEKLTRDHFPDIILARKQRHYMPKKLSNGFTTGT